MRVVHWVIYVLLLWWGIDCRQLCFSSPTFILLWCILVRLYQTLLTDKKTRNGIVRCRESSSEMTESFFLCVCSVTLLQELDANSIPRKRSFAISRLVKLTMRHPNLRKENWICFLQTMYVLIIFSVSYVFMLQFNKHIPVIFTRIHCFHEYWKFVILIPRLFLELKNHQPGCLQDGRRKSNSERRSWGLDSEKTRY